jgi:hypothetical protein
MKLRFRRPTIVRKTISLPRALLLSARPKIEQFPSLSAFIAALVRRDVEGEQ